MRTLHIQREALCCCCFWKCLQCYCSFMSFLFRITCILCVWMLLRSLSCPLPHVSCSNIYPILSYPNIYPILYYPILFYTILSYPILSCPILSYQTASLHSEHSYICSAANASNQSNCPYHALIVGSSIQSTKRELTFPSSASPPFHAFLWMLGLFPPISARRPSQIRQWLPLVQSQDSLQWNRIRAFPECSMNSCEVRTVDPCVACNLTVCE